MEDLVNTLARHVAKTSFETLSPRVVELTKLFILDTMGVVIAGSSAPGCGEVAALVKNWGGRPESTVAVYGGAVPAPAAAMANGMMAHALDLDDFHEESVVHCSCCQVPVGLAMAERQGKTGKDLITAVAIGMDLACRLGIAFGSGMGFVHSGTCNTFGAAANAARLLGLDEDGIRHALGICLSQTAGNVQATVDGALVKRMQPGLMGQAGVQAAFLAGCGITGPIGVFDGPFGFFELYRRGEVHPDRVTHRLGEFFEVENVNAKLFCGCSYVHPPAEAVVDIVTGEGISGDDIARLTVYLPRIGYEYVGRPFEVGEVPQVSAQFSVAYAVAAAALQHDLFVDQMQEEVIRDPRIGDLARNRVQVVVDEHAPDPAAFTAAVRLETRDGRQFYKKIDHLKGHPKNFLTKDEFLAKFRKAVKWSALPLPAENVERLIDLVGRLESVEDAGVLLRLAQPAR